MSPANGSPEPTSGVSPPSATPVPGVCWRRDFPGEERQLGVLRRWLASLLPPCPARDDVVSVANELGSNAIVHTLSGRGGRFTVEVTWYGPQVRVAVADGGAPAGPRIIDDPAGEHGRGLLVVHQLSARTGQRGDERGRLVWADIPWDDPGTAESASPQDRRDAAIRDGQTGLASRVAGMTARFGRSTVPWQAPGRREAAGLLAMTRHSTQPDGGCAA